MKVVRGLADECWEWSAFRTPGGYGMIRVGGKMELAHRVGWAVAHGPITPIDLQVLHTCDNPPCCNPAHLFLGTNYDNVRDKMSKGRASFPQPWRRGEKHHAAKLTEADVVAIRRHWQPGSARELAQRYGVSIGTIYKIVNHQGWTWIPS